MADKETIIKAFIRNFIIKEKRDRCYFELMNLKKRDKFTDRLNHVWDTALEMKYLIKIEKQFDNIEAIQKLLNFKDDQPCYVISDYDEFDDRIMLFNHVFKEIYTHDFATILLNTPADALFLNTEELSTRFIEKRN